jgi:2'-5' RNA ligase
MYSVWLLPTKEDELYLRRIVENLRQRYGGPAFPPHITVLGDIDVSLDVIEETVKNSTKGLAPFSVKKLGLEFSDYVFKSAYLSLEPSHQLKEINRRLARNLDRDNDYSFKPHVSLLYKVIARAERRRIASEFKIKDNFAIEQIAVEEISEKVENWKTHFVMDLGVA